MIKHGEEVVKILDLYRQGLSISAIARGAGLYHRTVQRRFVGGLEPLEPPVDGPRKPRPRLIDHFCHIYSNERRPTLGSSPEVKPF